MQPVTNSLINVTRKAVKYLQRDFFELEMLQSSKQERNIEQFCIKAFSRTKTLLQEELQKHSKFQYFSGEKFELADIPETVLFISPIDSIANFAKSLPFFGISITYLRKINQILIPTNVVINFPALGEIYYAEKGAGVWLEKTTHNLDKAVRLRVSGCPSLDNATIATDDLGNYLDTIKNARHFGSHCYEAVLLAAGKLDAICFSSLDGILNPGFELLVRESGGIIIQNDKASFISSNYNLADKFKQIFCKKPI
jgi:myo-inositol-1(or 4)-monophosphatase